MRQRQSFAIILVGKSILLREGLARILRSTNFRILASVACADDLLASKLQQHQPRLIVVHTGHDFDAGTPSRSSKITRTVFTEDIADGTLAHSGNWQLSVSMRRKISHAAKAARS